MQNETREKLIENIEPLSDQRISDLMLYVMCTQQLRDLIPDVVTDPELDEVQVRSLDHLLQAFVVHGAEEMNPKRLQTVQTNALEVLNWL